MNEPAKRVDGFSDIDPSSICYWKEHEDDHWMIFFPDRGNGDLLGDLQLHKVEEHEDGTITVTPSIKTWNRNNERHGYLTKGVWNEC